MYGNSPTQSRHSSSSFGDTLYSSHLHSYYQVRAARDQLIISKRLQSRTHTYNVRLSWLNKSTQAITACGIQRAAGVERSATAAEQAATVAAAAADAAVAGTRYAECGPAAEARAATATSRTAAGAEQAEAGPSAATASMDRPSGAAEGAAGRTGAA